MARYTCIVEDRIFEAVPIEDGADPAEEGTCACDLCVARPMSELCDALGPCTIDDRYHYWRIPPSLRQPELKPGENFTAEADLEQTVKDGVVDYRIRSVRCTTTRTCGTCLAQGMCPAGKAPWAEACEAYEPDPGLQGCCSALLLVLGFFGLVACAAWRGASFFLQ